MKLYPQNPRYLNFVVPRLNLALKRMCRTLPNFRIPTAQLGTPQWMLIKLCIIQFGSVNKWLSV